MERTGCRIPDATETARVRDPLLHARSRRSPDRSRTNDGSRVGLDARPLAGLTCDYLVTYSADVNDEDLVFKALADPTRRFLLDTLFTRDGRTLTELESELEMTRFGVMKHLKVLEEAGLVVP